MALSLKPLTDEVIQSMGLSTLDLWLVKIDGEVFGPFETASLHDYARENLQEFAHAEASLEDPQNFQPFLSHPEFHFEVPAEPVIEQHYWILNQGQKVGPLTRMAVDKKLEMGLLAMTDVVSTDDGHTWNKFFHVESFNPEGAGGVDALPVAPLESAFARAKEELYEKMDNHERTGSHAGLASLVYLGQKNEKIGLKLEEFDLKSLDETEVSRSLKWAIPSAVAGVGVLMVLGNFILTPSTTNEVAQSDGNSEVIMPSAPTSAEVPNPSRNKRTPSSYMPQPSARSGLTNSPPMHYNEYPQPQMNHHENEPDPMVDPVSEAEIQPQEPQEHSLVQNQQPGGESLDGVMSGGQDVDPQPETPVIEEAADF